MSNIKYFPFYSKFQAIFPRLNEVTKEHENIKPTNFKHSK